MNIKKKLPSYNGQHTFTNDDMVHLEQLVNYIEGFDKDPDEYIRLFDDLESFVNYRFYTDYDKSSFEVLIEELLHLSKKNELTHPKQHLLGDQAIQLASGLVIFNMYV